MAGNAHESRSTDRSPCGRDVEIARRLFDGDSIPQIARDTGLSESSIRAYQTGQRRPGIRQYMLELEHSVFASTRARLIHGKRKAVEVLIDALNDEDPAIRLKAASTLLREYVPGMNDGGPEQRGMTVVVVIQLIQRVRQEEAKGLLGPVGRPALPTP